jgi:hypothetical protein
MRTALGLAAGNHALARCHASRVEILLCPVAAPWQQVGKFSFMANSRARSVDDTEGLVKFVSDAKTDKILGAHIMGPNAGECKLCMQPPSLRCSFSML